MKPRSGFFVPDKYMVVLVTILMMSSVAVMVVSDVRLESPRKPIIIDTDFGTDIDDAFAIAGILSDSEADVKMIVVNVKTEEEGRARANIVGKMVETMGYSIPVYYGRNIGNDDYGGNSGSGVGSNHYGVEYRDVNSSLVNYSDFRVAVADLIDQHYGDVVYITTGPMTGLADLVNYLNDTQIQGIKYVAYGVDNMITSVDAMNIPRTPVSTRVVIDASNNRGLKLRAVNWHLTADNTDYSGLLVGQNHCTNTDWNGTKLDAEHYLNRTNNSVGQMLSDEFWETWIRDWNEVDPDSESCGSHLSIQWDWFIYYATSTTDGYNRRDECTDKELFGTFRFGSTSLINIKNDFIHSQGGDNVEHWYPCYSTTGGKRNARNRLIQNIMSFEEEAEEPVVNVTHVPNLDIITREEYIVTKCDGEECEKYKPVLPDDYGGEICFDPYDKKSLPSDINIYDKEDSVTQLTKRQDDKYCISGKEYVRLGLESLEINWTFVERINDQGSWYNCTYTLYKNPADSWVIQPGDWYLIDNEFGLVFESTENVSLMIEMDCNRPIYYDKNYEYYVESVGDVREREYTNFINCRKNVVRSSDCSIVWDEEMQLNSTYCPTLRIEEPNCSFEYDENEINATEPDTNIPYLMNLTDYTLLKNYFTGYTNGTHVTFDPEVVGRNISGLVENNTENQGNCFVEMENNDSSLVGYWHMNKHCSDYVYDSSGEGNDATHINSSDSWNASGKIGGGYTLHIQSTGNKECIEIPDDAYDSLSEGTILMWVKGNGNPFNYFFGGNNDDNIYQSRFLWYGKTEGNMTFSTRGDGGANLLAFTTRETLDFDDRWFHVVYGSNATGNFMYVNGTNQTLIYSTGDGSSNSFFSHSVGAQGGTSKYRIGGLYYTTLCHNSLNGTVDDVRIYNRRLMESEIKDIYENSTYSPKQVGTINTPTVNISNHNQTNITINCLQEPCGNVSVLTINYSTKDLKGYWGFNGLTSIEDSNNNQDTNATANVYFNLSNGIRQGFMYTQNGFINVSKTLTSGWREVTMCAWVKRNQSNNNYFIRKNDQIRIAGFTSSRWVFSVWNDTGSRCEIKTSDTISFGANTWYHACLNYDSTVGVENLTAYINGVKQSNKYNKTCQGVVDTRTTMFKIGGAIASTNMNGSIDEILLYNRSLTSAEHLSLYNSYFVQRGRRDINETNTTYHIPMNMTDTFAVISIEPQSTTNSSPIYDDIHYVFDNVNLTSDGAVASNVCSCAGSDTNMECDCSTHNYINSACNLGTGNLTFTNSGSISIVADVRANRLYFNTQCIVAIKIAEGNLSGNP